MKNFGSFLTENEYLSTTDIIINSNMIQSYYIQQFYQLG